MLRPKELKNFENTNKSIPTLPKVLSSVTQFYFQVTPKLYFLIWKLDDVIPFNQCHSVTAPPYPAQEPEVLFS